MNMREEFQIKMRVICSTFFEKKQQNLNRAKQKAISQK
jgi:hypothetical protein